MRGIAEEPPRLAALRRVATLVARDLPPEEVFGAVTEEVARVVGSEAVGMLRFEPDVAATLIAQSETPWDPPPLGTRFALEGDNVVTAVFSSGRPARVDDWGSASGPVADMARILGVRSAVATPIVVEGGLWGTMIAVTSRPEPLPADTESRIGDFTELVATAIASIAGREQRAQLAAEQASLRHVATLVARGASPAEVFDAVAEELGRLLGVGSTGLVRFEDGDIATVVAGWGRLSETVAVGARLPVDGRNVVSRIARTGRPARLDEYPEAATGPIGDRARRLNPQSAVGGPILVAGRLWGAMIAAALEGESLAPDAETRLGQFSELVATAIANAEARVELARLADEQAALRRVATLVAKQTSPAGVFDAVIGEVAELLSATQVGLMRAESASEVTILAHRGQDPHAVRQGMRVPLDGTSTTAEVLRTGCSARLNVLDEGSGTIRRLAMRSRANATVGAPITVEGEIWGVITASWTGDDAPPADAEARLTQFAELVATAIANADSRDQLAASRARVVTAADRARRQVVRDLHDGAQQRLIHTIITLKLAQRSLRTDTERTAELLADALAHAEQSNAELRELAQGILPAVLTRGGLDAAVDALVSRLDVPAVLDVTRTRLAPDVEASAYFIVAEALTNVLKHAQAARAWVTATVGEGELTVEVRDDGVGGADPHGQGLLGIGDRVAALGGRLRIESPRGGGTVLRADLPLPD